MPKIHNPHPYDLFCAVKGEIIEAGKSIEATAEEAERACQSSIFKIIDDKKVATKADSEDADVTEKAAAPAKKAAAKRGSKVAEVAAAPDMETR